MKKFILLLGAWSLVGCASMSQNPLIQDLVERTPQLSSLELNEPAEIEFVSPENGSTEVKGLTPITFLWKQPVLALQTHQGAKNFLEKNLRIEPPHPGEWRTLGASGIMFEPKASWPASTDFVIQPTATLLSDYVYQFSTPRVELESFEALNLVGKTPLVLTFNQAVDLKSVSDGFTITNESGGTIPLTVRYAERTLTDGDTETLEHQLELVPRMSWPENQAYEFTLPAGVYGSEGKRPSEKAIDFSFNTAGPLDLSKVEVPEYHDQALVIQFSAPVSTKTLVDNLVITPAPQTPLQEGELQYYYEHPYETNTLYIRAPDGAWDPNIEYEVSLKPSFQDIAGRALSEIKPIVFQTDLNAFFNPVYFPQDHSVFKREVNFQPTFSYGGAVESVTVTLNDRKETFALSPSLKDRQVWALDLRSVFPEIFTTSNQFRPGDYRLQVEVEYEDENRKQTYQSRFFISDFAVELKHAANNQLTIMASAYPGDVTLPSQVDMEVFVGDWQTEQRLTRLSNVSRFQTLEVPRYQLKMVKVIAGDKIGYGSPQFEWGINVWDSQAEFGAWRYDQNYSAVIFTDRPLYKPGQDLFYKGYIRELALFGQNFPLKDVTSDFEPFEYKLEIYDPEYELVEALTGQVTAGSFDGEYALDPDLKLGNYRLVFSVEGPNGTVYTTETPFWMEEYRKPNFLISSSFSESRAVAESSLEATVKAQYAFGGAVVDRPVEYTVSLFGLAPCEWWCWGPRATRDKVVTRGEGRLNQQGELVIPINLKEVEYEDVDWNLLTLNANVLVSAAEQSASEVSVPFYTANRQFSLEAVPYFVDSASQVSLRGSLEDLDKRALAGEMVALELGRTKWVRNQRKNGDGNFYGEWESVTETLETFETETDARGQFRFDFRAPTLGGEYELVFEARDENRRDLTATRNFWVAGSDLDQVRENNTNKILTLFPSQESYAIGETVEVFVPNPSFKADRVHATIERGEVLESLIFNTDNNTVSFTVEDWMSPNIFVSVLMEGRDEAGNLQVRWGAHPIKIEDPSRQLNLEVKTDKAIYRPGETVRLQLESTVNDEGVPADIAVAVVDQSLLALKARVPLQLMEALIGEWPLGVQTYHTLANYISVADMEQIMEEVQTIADRMELGFGGGGGKGDENQPRGDFRDTAAFIAQAQTNANGQGTVEFRLPDNLTTWNIWVTGATNSNAFGTQNADFLVTLPLLVSEIVPNFLRSGDTVEMGLLIYRDDSALEREDVAVTLTVPPALEIVGEASKTVTVEQEARVFFTVRVKPTTILETVNLGFSIEGVDSGLKDAVQLSRTIEPAAQNLTAGEFQRLVDSYNLNLLSDPEAFSSTLQVRVFASLATSLEALVDIAERVNYGCTEQRLALLATKIYQRNLDQALNRSSDYVSTTELESMRNEIEEGFTGEGYAFWKSSPTPDFWVTTSVLEKAPLLTQAQVPLNQTHTSTAAQWLKKELLRECDQSQSWRCPHAISRLHAAAVLVDYNLIDANELTYLTTYTDSIEGKVWWLLAAQKLSALPPSLLATKESYLESVLQAYNREDRYGFWTETEGAFYSQDERLTALVLELLMRENRFDSEFETVARYLSDSRQKSLSGNSAMRILKTLTLYTQTQEDASVGANFTVANTTTDEVLLKGNLADKTQSQTFTQTSLYTEPQTLSFQTDKPILADITFTDSLPAEAIVANARGFWIERTVSPFGQADQADTDINSLTQGENYEVRLKVVTAQPYRQVMVEDLIPSGAEIVNFALDNTDQTLRPEAEEGCEWGWCQPLYQHQEMRYDRARFFMDYLPAGTHEITYLLQPRLVGEYEWLPARVEAMYYPELSANTEGRAIEITAPSD